MPQLWQQQQQQKRPGLTKHAHNNSGNRTANRFVIYEKLVATTRIGVGQTQWLPSEPFLPNIFFFFCLVLLDSKDKACSLHYTPLIS